MPRALDTIVRIRGNIANKRSVTSSSSHERVYLSSSLRYLTSRRSQIRIATNKMIRIICVCLLNICFSSQPRIHSMIMAMLTLIM